MDPSLFSVPGGDDDLAFVFHSNHMLNSSEKEEIHAGHRSGATQSLYRFTFFVASAILHLKPLNVVLLLVILRQVFLYNDILGFGLPCWPGIQPPGLEKQPDSAD